MISRIDQVMCKRSVKRANIPAMHAYAYTCKQTRHAGIRIHMETHAYTPAHADMYVHIHAYTAIQKKTCTHTPTHTHRHMDIEAHTKY